jgi:hypothetical protein
MPTAVLAVRLMRRDADAKNAGLVKATAPAQML